MTQGATRMHVAYDVTLVGSNQGGSGVYARGLLQALQARDDVDVALLDAPGGAASWVVSGAAAELRKVSPAVYHGPGFLAPIRSPVPVVLTIHDLAMSRMAGGHPIKWRLFYQLILPRLARRAAIVLTATEATKSDLVDMYGIPAERIVVTPYGIDEQFLKPADHARAGGVPTILFSGPPIRRKNLDLVLRALASAPAGTALGEARLEITNSGPADFPGYARFIEERGLQGRVRWLGAVAKEQMPQLYSSADVLAYPSFIEGFGFPPLEAMASGTPVVAANASCLPEVLGDAALMVDPNDDEGFASAIEKLLTDAGARQQAVERGAARARGYTWARCAEMTVAAYRRAATRSKTA